MKNLEKKISAINEKYWGMFTEHSPIKYQQMYEAYIKEMQALIIEYSKSHCDCSDSTGCISEYVCNNCGRTQRN